MSENEEVLRLLIASYNALRSYQYGNASPALAQEVAEELVLYLHRQGVDLWHILSELRYSSPE